MVSSVKALDAVCVFTESSAQNFVLQSNKSYRIKPTMKPISSTPATHHVNPIINIERTQGEAVVQDDGRKIILYCVLHEKPQQKYCRCAGHYKLHER